MRPGHLCEYCRERPRAIVWRLGFVALLCIRCSGGFSYLLAYMGVKEIGYFFEARAGQEVPR